jgi:CheY-like chemotaxis protein
MQLRYVHTSPVQLVEDAVALFVDMANAKGLELVATSEVVSLYPYDLDADRIRQMIGNLVNNAIKFTESGRIRVNVSLVAERDAPEMLEFSVEDTGIGILLEHQDSLFKRFTQIDASSTRGYDGSGLGLYIVRQFAQMMGGQVGFASTLGKGSRFWFRVLANEVTVEHLVSNHQPRMSSEIAKSTLAGHVLVAEDNPTNRVILKTMLNRMGLTVRLVEDGQVAFETYTSSESFDAVLMDISMPRMDGLEATRRIRLWEQKEAHERCPIIAITANAYAEDRRACLDAGMDDFIAKPIMVDQLADCLAKRLR